MISAVKITELNQHIRKSGLDYQEFHYVIVNEPSDEIKIEILNKVYSADNVLSFYEDEDYIIDIETYLKGRANKLVTVPFSPNMKEKKYLYIFSLKSL